MRTTLTLDADVSMLLKKDVARDGVSFKEAVNRALRRGLLATQSEKPKRVFKQKTWDFGPVPSPAELKEMLLKEDVERFLRASRR
jgi:hypothetical protein